MLYHIFADNSIHLKILIIVDCTLRNIGIGAASIGIILYLDFIGELHDINISYGSYRAGFVIKYGSVVLSLRDKPAGIIFATTLLK